MQPVFGWNSLYSWRLSLIWNPSMTAGVNKSIMCQCFSRNFYVAPRVFLLIVGFWHWVIGWQWTAKKLSVWKVRSNIESRDCRWGWSWDIARLSHRRSRLYAAIILDATQPKKLSVPAPEQPPDGRKFQSHVCPSTSNDAKIGTQPQTACTVGRPILRVPVTRRGLHAVSRKP